MRVFIPSLKPRQISGYGIFSPKSIWRLNSLLAARYFLLVARYYFLVACYFLFVARYFLLVARYFLLVARYFLLAARYFFCPNYCEINLRWTAKEWFNYSKISPQIFSLQISEILVSFSVWWFSKFSQHVKLFSKLT